ncbi:MAG TPA: hypothetical protein VGI73_11505 [Solirubrobacterales bacterium]|jgi:hypothetical protein
MENVTEKKHKVDIWTDPDPQPEDVRAWFADPENEWVSVTVPPNSGLWIEIPDGVSYEEWEERRAGARAHGERLPEEITAEEELEAAQAAEEKDWTPEQKAAREAERLAAREALEKLHH